MIYVANPATQYSGAGSILGFSADANGNLSPTVRIAGKDTGLGYDSTSIAVDKLGRLYTTGTGETLGYIEIWRSAGNVDAKPIASLSGKCSNFTSVPAALTFDRNGHLWVACSGEGGGEILEYPRIQADATGDLSRRFPPLRTLYGTPTGQDHINAFTSIALNANGLVSVEEDAGGFNRRRILTFAAAQNGRVAPLSRLVGFRTLLNGQNETIDNSQGGMTYDSQGRLVVCTSGKSKPQLLTFARGASGNVAPISTLSVAGCKGIAIDPKDNVYVAFGPSITEYAAGATGSATPLRVISGNLTGLTNATSIAF